MRTRYSTRVLAGMALLVMCFLNANAQDSDEPDQKAKDETTIIKVGDKAPDFTVEMLDGRSLKLSDMKGKVVLLNFWATWCGPCMAEFKEIPEKLIKRFEGKEDFIFLPISRGESNGTVQKKMNQLRRTGIIFPVGLDPDKTIYELYAKMYIPRNFLIDKDGKVVYSSIGYEEKEFTVLTDKIDELLNLDILWKEQD